MQLELKSHKWTWHQGEESQALFKYCRCAETQSTCWAISNAWSSVWHNWPADGSRTQMITSLKTNSLRLLVTSPNFFLTYISKLRTGSTFFTTWLLLSSSGRFKPPTLLRASEMGSFASHLCHDCTDHCIANDMIHDICSIISSYFGGKCLYCHRVIIAHFSIWRAEYFNYHYKSFIIYIISQKPCPWTAERQYESWLGKNVNIFVQSMNRVENFVKLICCLIEQQRAKY